MSTVILFVGLPSAFLPSSFRLASFVSHIFVFSTAFPSSIVHLLPKYIRTSLKKARMSTETTTMYDIMQFLQMFRDLFLSASYDYVEPFSCMYFTTTGETSFRSVYDLIQLFDKSKVTNDNIQFPWSTLVMETPCVVPLVGS